MARQINLNNTTAKYNITLLGINYYKKNNEKNHYIYIEVACCYIVNNCIHYATLMTAQQTF